MNTPLTEEEMIELYNRFAVMTVEALDAVVRSESDSRKVMMALEMMTSKRNAAADLKAGRW